MSTQDLQSYYDQWRFNPAGQGLLRAVPFAEGTSGPDGYRTLFGGGKFDSFTRHPDQVVRSGGYASAAAGRGQFMPKTWEGVAKALGEQDFSPEAQDRGILYLADQRLKSIGGLKALEKEGFSQRVSALLAPEWASLPTESGRSFYGQPVKSLAELQREFGAGTQSAGAPSKRPPSAIAGDGGNMLSQFMGSSSDDALGELSLGRLKVPGLADIGTGSTGLPRTAAITSAILPMLAMIDPVNGRMAGEQLQGSLRRAEAGEILTALHGDLARTMMPETPPASLTDLDSGRTEVTPSSGQATQVPSNGQAMPGIKKTAYGDNVQFETPDGARYRLIHGLKDLKTGTYIQGGWGPQGASHYGDHFDIARVDGGFFDRSALDKYAMVGDQPLSAGLTVKGGEFGASRDGGSRVHQAWDYAFDKGARLQLTNGARWLL